MKASDIASRLGSQFVAMHPIYPFYGKDMRQLALTAFKKFTDYAEKVGVPLAVENLMNPVNLFPDSVDKFSHLFNHVR